MNQSSRPTIETWPACRWNEAVELLHQLVKPYKVEQKEWLSASVDIISRRLADKMLQLISR